MRLARLLVFSALAARAGAEAAADGDSPSRWSIYALTGGRYDAPTAAAAADAAYQCPVMAADGNTYDRSSIEAWLKTGKKTSPMTGAPLAHLGLAPNNLVRSMVSEYRDASSRGRG